jgi:diacylglycerol kinase (ATP)
MPSDNTLLFVNPVAGRGRTRRRLAGIVRILDTAGIAADIRTSHAAGDLEAQVRDAVNAGAGRILVAGGDGSIHEAVNGILSANRKAALGVIPTGTGNDFAKACGIPLDWRRATRELGARLQAGNALRRVDVGRMNGRWFANGAGIGFDAKVTRTAQSCRLPLGGIVYLLTVLRCLVDGITTPRMSIRADGVTWDDAVTLASIANGPWVGGMFHIAPMAANDDGAFDLVIAAPVTRRRVLVLLPMLLGGRHLGEAEISHFRVRRLTISADADTPSQLDGEVQPLGREFEIELLPGALDLL